MASGGDASFGATAASCQVIPAVLGSTLNSAEQFSSINMCVLLVREGRVGTKPYSFRN